MKDNKKYSEKDWKEIASYLSGENKQENEIIAGFMDNKGLDIKNYFDDMDKSRSKDKINIDEAWDKLYSRLEDDNLIGNENKTRALSFYLARIAAVLIILVTATFTTRFLINNRPFARHLAVETEKSEKNRLIALPDGSTIILNRDSKISYRENNFAENRKVTLSGEAFFDISPDTEHPFIVSAAKAEIKVLGTSFNVITSNSNKQVEVFVKTGKVLLSSTDGQRQITLEPGYIGTINGNVENKTINSDNNYLSWNTEVLEYEGARLEQVFSDLKRVYDISIEVETESILDQQITTTYNKNTPETIIQSICTGFNLTFEKKNEIYYLSK